MAYQNDSLQRYGNPIYPSSFETDHFKRKTQ